MRQQNKHFFTLIFVLAFIMALSAQEQYLYYSYPNCEIPRDETEPGVADTIIITDNIIIEDINFYVGINTYSVGATIIVTVFSS